VIRALVNLLVYSASCFSKSIGL